MFVSSLPDQLQFIAEPLLVRVPGISYKVDAWHRLGPLMTTIFELLVSKYVFECYRVGYIPACNIGCVPIGIDLEGACSFKKRTQPFSKFAQGYSRAQSLLLCQKVFDVVSSQHAIPHRCQDS